MFEPFRRTLILLNGRCGSQYRAVSVIGSEESPLRIYTTQDAVSPSLLILLRNCGGHAGHNSCISSIAISGKSRNGQLIHSAPPEVYTMTSHTSRGDRGGSCEFL